MNQPVTERRTCGEIMAPFVEALDQRGDLPPVQIIGGNGAAALLNKDTVIDLDRRTISAPAACDLPRLRVDGSVRDMDTLVLSTDPNAIGAIEELGERAVHGELTVSVFGLKTIADLERQRARPLSSTARVFLADRYVTTTYDDRNDLVAVDGFKALFPFQVPIGIETLETFELTVAGRAPIPTSHPGTTILNYLTRSISGLRAKDHAKVETMTENVLTRYPAVKAWMLDGPGRTTIHLARLLHTLRGPRHRAHPLVLGTQLQITPYRPAELGQHPGFMNPEMSPGAKGLVIGASHLKSSLLGRVEANTAIVRLWRSHVEERVGRIIHNDL